MLQAEVRIVLQPVYHMSHKELQGTVHTWSEWWHESWAWWWAGAAFEGHLASGALRPSHSRQPTATWAGGNRYDSFTDSSEGHILRTTVEVFEAMLKYPTRNGGGWSQKKFALSRLLWLWDPGYFCIPSDTPQSSSFQISSSSSSLVGLPSIFFLLYICLCIIYAILGVRITTCHFFGFIISWILPNLCGI